MLNSAWEIGQSLFNGTGDSESSHSLGGTGSMFDSISCQSWDVMGE